ncbi:MULTISPECIES: hypothetical protein [Azotobacter]|nr:hypothetical protein [Azotobacter vinelandii]WKN24245.1 hypothetical protein AVAEIV_002397 [Azotobacter vinelandii]GLK61598.1 hypothetical protein GCM10017624_37620 [Azotobacter vinelandii]SFX59052.1 hypothetical protein SAMN04244547_02064 [Azotobacter vinelandii]
MKPTDESTSSSAHKLQINRWRFGAGLATLSASLGILLAMAGTASLLGQAPTPGAGRDLPELSVGAAVLLLILGLLLLWAGIHAWRVCRRGLRAIRHSGSAFTPTKKHD